MFVFCDFWEIYGGVCALTLAVRKQGLRAHAPLDISVAPWQDVLKPVVQEWVLGRIRRRQVRWVHLAPRCRDFSRARRCGTRTTNAPEGDGTLCSEDFVPEEVPEGDIE